MPERRFPTRPAPLALPRRTLLHAGLAAAGLAAVSGTPAYAANRSNAPAVLRSGRPRLTNGIASGDPTAGSSVIWARADRTARLLVEVSRTPDFSRFTTVRGPVLTAQTDLTGKVDLRGLPAGSELFYRVVLEDPDRHGVRGEPLSGRLVTAPARRSDVRFLWSADMAGQGWGINPDLGGIRIFERMRALQPDFYLNSGDSVYADGVIPATVTLPDGRVWRNVTTEAKSKVAETLDEYRGQYAYNLLDEHVRAFAADVPQINQWDDHEVRNNWYPGQIIDDTRYTEKRIDVLAARGRQAFFEWMPIRTQRSDPDGRIYRKISYGPLLDVFVLDMRTYKDPNTDGLETVPDGGVLGWRQLRWLTDGLLKSRATWKIIANDLPLSLVVPDGATAVEAIGQGDPGAPKGREIEIASLLSTLRQKDIRNVVWLTADVHHAAAHHYSPDRASFQDFEPFWEFVGGPIHAGAFRTTPLDPTFGPEEVFVSAPPRDNTSPLEGFQHFGEVEISGETAELTVRLRDQDAKVLFTKSLAPAAR
ncbi:alkaline phosphatase D family protein [Actinopolymorpha alba]|uniref:alkaline phosphatase D family protein n=1 Tax=Actinopolymorpha alba TaxID=533267 RepID=UPI000362884D|nr:alkaline phosphatase D family protein [Actinopolymorpha alba]